METNKHNSIDIIALHFCLYAHLLKGVHVVGSGIYS